MIKISLLTFVALVAFAANSLLCRLALTTTAIDAASFTMVRISSGALMLWILLVMRSDRGSLQGDWLSAFALFAYAACFSFAYLGLHAGAGALILFCSVQITMIAYGLFRGESLLKGQVAGLLLALFGLIYLLLPGAAAPAPLYAALMLAAGVSWGIYSLHGRSVAEPLSASTGNFVRASGFAFVLSILMFPTLTIDALGFTYAVLSGAFASGCGYAVWYMALPRLKATTASVVQLCVPIFAAIGGVCFLDEPLTLRLLLSSAIIIAGILLVITRNWFVQTDRQV